MSCSNPYRKAPTDLLRLQGAAMSLATAADLAQIPVAELTIAASSIMIFTFHSSVLYPCRVEKKERIVDESCSFSLASIH